MAERDTSADGLRNKIENAVLNNLRPFWTLVNRTPWLQRVINRLVVDNAVRKLPLRPLPLSTMHDYPAWSSLTDRTWFGRYLPPAPYADHPALDALADLYRVRPEGPRLSQRSTLLFPAFAQWFTDGFLMTDTNRLKTRTNHQIDLCQLYGLTPDMTDALRLKDATPGRRGRLCSVMTQTGEWAPPLFDDTGARRPGLEALPTPVQLRDEWPLAKKRSLFAFGGERANSNLYTASVNTLFLREHNRLCTMLEQQNPAWDDDRVFETARNINIVQLIRIVVEEYINHISPYWLQLLADPAPAYRAAWNRPELDPGRVQPALSLAQPGAGKRVLAWRAGSDHRLPVRQCPPLGRRPGNGLRQRLGHSGLGCRPVQHRRHAASGRVGEYQAGPGQPVGVLQRLPRECAVPACDAIRADQL